jgi:malonate-semialdehyde dehydrogenase (acetylating) / methylmalonate-semialdehyde dehydrogenase
VKRAASIELGTGMGAIIDRPGVERIEGAVAEAEAKGARVLLDGRGKKPASSDYAGGYWIGPSILDGVDGKMRARHEEVFGPLLSIVRVPTLSAALAAQSESPFGNAASVFTQSGSVAQMVAEHAKAGMIGVNVGVPVPREPFSFGGVRESKYGHGDITGPSSLDFWTNTKKITRKWAVQADATWMG